MPKATNTTTLPGSAPALLGGAAAVAARFLPEADAAACEAPVVVAQPAGPDADLLHLGQLLDEAAAREQIAWDTYERTTGDADHQAALALNRRTGEIVDQIEPVAAKTVAGLLVKLRAISWCRGGEPITAENLRDKGHPTTDMRLLAAMVNDLAAMG